MRYILSILGALLLAAPPTATIAQQNIAVTAEIVSRNNSGEQCRIAISLRAEQRQVSFRRDQYVCKGYSGTDAQWRSAPQNSSQRYTITCSTKFGDPTNRCSDGTVQESPLDFEGTQKSVGTYSAILREGLISFTDEAIVSGTYRNMDGISGKFSDSSWIQSVTVQLAGNQCQVTAYALRSGDLSENLAKQVKCTVSMH